MDVRSSANVILYGYGHSNLVSLPIVVTGPDGIQVRNGATCVRYGTKDLLWFALVTVRFAEA